MHDESGSTSPLDTSASSSFPFDARSAIVITADPSTAGCAFSGSQVRDITVLGPDASTWPDPGAAYADLALVADLGADPVVLGPVLAFLDRAVADGGAVALTVEPGCRIVPDPGAWAVALAGWCYAGVAVGSAPSVLVRRAVAHQPISPLEQACLVLGSLTGLAARTIEAAPEPHDVAPAPPELDKPAPHGALHGATAALQPESGQHAHRGPRRPPWFRRRRVQLAIAVTGLVAIAAAVVVGAALGTSWWGWLLVAGLLLATALRQETWNRRMLRRSDRSARDAAATTAAATSVIAAVRAQATSTRALSARLVAGLAETRDAASSGAGLAVALRPGGALDSRLRREFDQVQSMVNLFARVDLDGRVPPMRGWAASPDVLNLLLDELVARRPATVLECGSGVSTLWMALAARRHDISCRIVSLEHDAAFLEQTRLTLERHGVAHLVDLRLAPLAPVSVEGRTTPWYDVSALDGVHGAGLVFIDGPPESVAPMARFPALPLLVPHLAEDAILIVDDAARPDEARALERWVRLHPDFSVQTVAAEKGAAILRRIAASAAGDELTNVEDTASDD